MRVIFDLKGCVMHALHAGTDQDFATRLPSGGKVNGVGHCLANFTDRYLLPALEDVRLNEIICVGDDGSAYRKALYPDYKAHRKDKTEEDAAMSARVDEAMAAVKDLLKGLGVPLVDCPGTEGDDVIAFLCQKLRGPKLIHTVDQDLLQLSSEDTAVFLKGEVNTEGYAIKNSKKEVLMYVQPRHIALCKSMVGDTSDGYKGIDKFGPSSFHKLAEEVGEDGLDELIEIIEKEDLATLRAAASQSKAVDYLLQHYAEWHLGWKLAKLHPEIVEARTVLKAVFKENFNGEVALDERKSTYRFNRLRWTKRVPSRARVRDLSRLHRCPDVLEKLDGFLPDQELVTAEHDPAILLEILKGEFEESPFVAIDWETTDQLRNPAFVEACNGREYVDMISSTITGAGFTFGRNLQHTWYLSFGHADTDNLPRSFLVEVLESIPKHIPKVIQNYYFEFIIAKNSLGYELSNAHDTKVMASYVDENLPSGLKDSSKHWLNYDQIRYDQVIEKGMTMSDYPASHVFQYGADDPLVTAHLYDLYSLIMEIEGTKDFCFQNEFLPIEDLGDAFIAGVSVDWDELERQRLEDEATYSSNMAKLRGLIEANQTSEMVSKGAEEVYKEWSPEVEAKVRLKFKDKGLTPEEMTEEVNKALTVLRTEIDGRVRYAPWVEVRKKAPFAFTVLKLNPVLKKLGLPEIEDVKATYLSQWLGRLPADLPAKSWRFAEKMVEAASFNTATKKTELQFVEFRELAEGLMDAGTEWQGSELNIDSPDQMVVLLYGMLGLPVRMRQFNLTKGQINLGLQTPFAQANEDALVTAMAEDTVKGDWKREALEALLAARKARTRLKMFYWVYPKWRHPADGLIHPQVNSCGTETRRPTGSNPNPLTWPKKGDGVKFRHCILPNAKLGHDLVGSIDWSQQELRVAGASSMDKALLDCYIGQGVEHVLSGEVKKGLGPELLAEFMKSGTKDVHTQTACGLLKKTYDEVARMLEEGSKEAKNARNTAKPINFGGNYGIGAGKLARQLICTVEEAKKYLDDKKALYFRLEEWRAEVIKLAHEQGYVSTVYGNRRHVFDDILDKDDGMRGHVERQVVNYLIQGVCADNLKKVMTEIRQKRIFERHKAVLLSTIYDEVVFTCHHTAAVPLILEVHEAMTRDIPGLCVPMLAEASLGINFGDQVEIGAWPTPAAIQEAVSVAFKSKNKLQEAA